MLCFEDMIDVAKPGDRVTVTGIYKALPVRVNPRNRAVKSVYKTHILALHVQKDGQSQLFSLSGAPLARLFALREPTRHAGWSAAGSAGRGPAKLLQPAAQALMRLAGSERCRAGPQSR